MATISRFEENRANRILQTSKLQLCSNIRVENDIFHRPVEKNPPCFLSAEKFGGIPAVRNFASWRIFCANWRCKTPFVSYNFMEPKRDNQCLIFVELI